MASRQINVEILGDSSSLEKAFIRSAKAAQQFKNAVSSSATGNALKQQTEGIRGIVAAEEALIKVRSRKGSSLGPFRVAGVGLAAGLGVFAATQAVRELTSRLEETGEAAFTTEGRLKNMAAALTSGNLIGAMDALFRAPKTLAEAGIPEIVGKDQLAALRQVAAGQTRAFHDVEQAAKLSGEELERLHQIEVLAGTGDEKLAKQKVYLVDMLRAQSAATDALASSTEKLLAVDDRAGPRGPGARAFETPYRRPGMPTLPPISPSQRRELELIGKEQMARIPLLRDRLRQLNNQMEDFHGNQEQRLKILTNIRNTEAEIAAIYADQTARRKQAAEEARRAAEAARARAEAARQERIRTATGWLEFGVERAEATETVRDDVKAYRQLEKFLMERVRQEGRTLELVRDLWRTRQKIRDLNDKESDADPLAGLKQASTKELLGILSAGTGLAGVGRRTLAGNIAGLQLPPIYLTMDSQVVGSAVTKQQTRTGRRTSQQTSGRRG